MSDTANTTTDAAAPAGFTLVQLGNGAGLVCEGDVCFLPGE